MEVRDMDLAKVKSFYELAQALLKSGGFMGKNVGEAVEIMLEMFRDEECRVFLCFTGNTVATGLRGVYKTLVQKKLVDLIITTTGAIDHDIARSWKPYYHGEFSTKDESLLNEGIHRLGNIFIPFENYGELIEEKISKILEELYKSGVREISTHELCRYLGEKAVKSDSILYWSSRNNIPIIVPGPFDGAVGSQIWFFQQTHRDFKLNLFKDEELISETVFEAKKTGGIIIGGGISKHHLLWWNQFKGGLDYAIQITTAIEWDGSLSGARLEEAISWRKVKPKARAVNVWSDATIVLPLMVKAVLEKLETVT